LGFALDEAEYNGSPLPVTRLVDSYYAEVQELGGNRWDTSSLLARLKSQFN
jgi:3-hydroxyisobutyrate dehydrogenase-like beta-hydroxyacid dehydrogenase